jgi:cation transport ATPase
MTKEMKIIKMKKLITLTILFIGLTSFAQDKNTKTTIEVNGVCGMCKARIEKVCLQTKGVKLANWSIATHELKLVYDARKTNLETIQENIAAAGHDTPSVTATEEAYNSVAPCCKYRDEEVVKSHH